MQIAQRDAGRMFVGNLLDDREAQAGALGLGRHIGLEGALEHLLGKTVAVVEDVQPHGARLAGVGQRQRGAHDDAAIGAVLHRVERVLHEVVDDLAQLAGVALDAGQVGPQVGDQSPVLLRLGIEAQDLLDQRIEIQRLELGRRQAGVVAELVDQLLHRLHLVDDGGHRAHQHGLVGAFELGLQLVLQTLGRQLDGRQRVLDLVGQPAGDLAPGRRALGRDDLGDVIEHDQARALGQGRPAHQQAQRLLLGIELKLEGLLPELAVHVALGRVGAEVLLEAGIEGGRELGQPGHLGQRPADIGRQRQAQDARGARVHGLKRPGRVEHEHAGREVVEDGLQMGAGALQLGHAALHLLARVGQLPRHVGEGARQPTQFVARCQHRPHRQITLGHLANAVGQHQQRARELIAQRDRQQQRGEHGQDQHQGQRAEVHPAQADPLQRALLVLAVGRLHRQRIAQNGCRHALHHHQIALAQAQAQLGVRQQGQRADPCAALQGLGLILQALQLGDDAAAGLVEQGAAGSVGGQLAGVAAALQQDLAIATHQRDGAHAELVAQPLQRQQLRGAGIGELFSGVAGAVAEIGHHRVQRAAPEVEAGLQRTGQLDVEPGLDAAVHELVGHRIDHQPRHHADEGKDAGQLEQQPAAEAAAPHPQHQAHRGHQNDQGQHRRDRDIDPEQPVVMAFEEAPLAGGADRQQEGQHAGDARQGHQRDDPAPARGPGHAARVTASARSRH
mmetsp:Transcript_53686/g.126315  ORF Transcript_53686/g.126315 Transcript_53686/m.126315 type:complete len:732 (-) Transcript_53686:1050-3245(-)